MKGPKTDLERLKAFLVETKILHREQRCEGPYARKDQTKTIVEHSVRNEMLERGGLLLSIGDAAHIAFHFDNLGRLIATRQIAGPIEPWPPKSEPRTDDDGGAGIPSAIPKGPRRPLAGGAAKDLPTSVAT